MSKLTAVDSWTELKSLVDQAIGLSGQERDDFLDHHCGSNARLRAHVVSLLEMDATAVSGEPDFLPGAGLEKTRVGPYRILKELGHGGMGAVYLAERADGEFEHRVAIKVVGRGPLTRSLHRRFLLERQVLARLTHPNIARLLDGGTTEDGAPYLVMEFIEGQTVLKHCAERRLGLEERLRLFIGICRGVSYAHRNLVVHRDLKPGNILVRSDGTPKLLDFGIAKLLDAAEEGLTVAGQTPGTLGYTSPEQLRGEPVSTTSDVYSLGVILFEMLTGERPFGPTEGALVAVARAMRGEEPTLASRVIERGAGDLERPAKPQQLKGDLDRILSRALAGDPLGRYGSAQELADDLERFLHHEPVSVMPPRPGYVLLKFMRRRAGTVIAGSLIGLSLLGGLVARSFEARRAEQQRATAVAEREKAEELAAFMVQDLWSSLQPLGRLGLMAPVSQKLMAYYEDRAAENLSPEEKERLIQTYSALAEVAFASGQAERGLEIRKQISAELEALALPVDPESRRHLRREVIRAKLDLAMAHKENGDGASALATLEEAVERIAELEVADGRDIHSVLLKLESLDSAGVAFYDQGELNEAREKFQAAHELADTLTIPEAAPEELVDEIRYWQQTAVFHLGVAEADLGSTSQALNHLERAVELADSNWRSGPDDLDNLFGLTLTHSALAGVLAQAGRFSQALEAAQSVVPPLDEAVQRDPANAEARYQLTTLLVELASILETKGDSVAARAALERTVEIAGPLVKTTSHTYLLDSYVRALLKLGRVTEAEGIARGLLAQGWDHQDFRALCAEHGLLGEP